MSAPVRVYIDTNIFIYHLFNQGTTLSSKARRFFYKIQDGTFRGVTTTFTRSEYLAVIKEEIATQSGSPAPLSRLQTAMQTLDNFMKNMGIEVFESDDLVNQDGKFFSEAHSKVEASTPARISGKWKSLNGADSLILTFAERANCAKIATNDAGFKNTNSRIVGHILQEEY